MRAHRPYLSAVILALASILRLLPLKVSLGLSSTAGFLGYCFLSKKRRVAYANLKTVFSAKKTPAQLQRLTRKVFDNFSRSFIELLCISKIRTQGFRSFITVKGAQNIDNAIAQGKGVIFLAIHSGNWELGNVSNAMMGHPYNLVANEQRKTPELNTLFNECRSISGARLISPGIATKEVVRALKRNEIVTLVFDQGGQEGVPIEFLGKTATMSSGSIRLALKYKSALCPVWIERGTSGTHLIEYFPAIPLIETGNLDQDILSNATQITRLYEKLVEQHPEEYLWFYKVFKYTTDAQTVILNDGNPKHLTQSKNAALKLKEQLSQLQKNVSETVINLDFQNNFVGRCFPAFVFFSRISDILCNESLLRYFLTTSCYEDLMKVKADAVISCGEAIEGVNFIISKNHQAKSMILTPV